MSTLRVDTIQNAAGTDSPISVPGTAKAWVNFNGTGTVAIRASYNVSSITDNGVGDYTVNFTNALADANYSCQVTASQGGSGNIGITAGELEGGTRSSSAIRMRISQYATNADLAFINVAIFR